MKPIGRHFVLFAALALVAVPALADVYTVTLTGGTTFESRYQPIQDPDDPAKILLMTDNANWIALPKRMVRSVASTIEARGFGRVLDSSTVELGYLRNDAPVPEEGGDAPADPAAALLQYFQQQDNQAPYSMEQFVEPEEASGMPVNWTRYNTPPVGSPDRFRQ